MDPGNLDKLQNLARETLAELAQAVCAQGGVDAGRGLRGRGGEQRHHDPPGARHRPRAARHGPVHHGDPAVPRGPARPTWAWRHRAPAGPRGGVPRVRRLRGRRHHGRAAGQRDGPGRRGSGCSSTSAPTARSCWATGTGCMATAAPAGPAFEGAAIRCGMRAADGAIEVVTMTAGRADPEGDRRRRAAGPVRLRPGRRGDRPGQGGPARLLRPVRQPRSGRGDRAGAGELADQRSARSGCSSCTGGRRRPAEDSIYLSQRDVRELQFAKAAIATGWQILLEEAGLEAADVKQVLLAGSFGSYLSPASAIRIGLVPKRAGDAGGVRGQRGRRGAQDGAARACASGPAAWRCWRR
mgnify:CR=1 FL=1